MDGVFSFENAHDVFFPRFGADASRICAYFPFYEASDELIAGFSAALRAASLGQG